jgi:hypothetical protein
MPKPAPTATFTPSETFPLQHLDNSYAINRRINLCDFMSQPRPKTVAVKTLFLVIFGAGSRQQRRTPFHSSQGGFLKARRRSPVRQRFQSTGTAQYTYTLHGAFGAVPAQQPSYPSQIANTLGGKTDGVFTACCLRACSWKPQESQHSG